MYIAIKNKYVIAEAETIADLVPMIAKVRISSQYTDKEAIRDYISNNINDLLLAKDVLIAHVANTPKKLIKVETSDIPTFTYSDYVDKKCTYEQFYRQFVSQSTIDMVGNVFKISTLIESLKEDINLNNIPLNQWDILAERITLKVSAKKAGLSLSQSSRVCIVKEAARMLCENYSPVS